MNKPLKFVVQGFLLSCYVDKYPCVHRLKGNRDRCGIKKGPNEEAKCIAEADTLGAEITLFYLKPEHALAASLRGLGTILKDPDDE